MQTVYSLLAVAALALPAAGAVVDLPRFPSLSPDGSVVVFSWRGDLWRANSAGGDATRLTSNPAAESRSAFTPDGSRIVFESERDGLKNLWSMTPDGGDLRRLTELDAPFALTSVGKLGENTVAFLESSLEGDLYRSSRPFVVPIAGGTPVRLHDAFGGGANASADGKKVLFERGGSGLPRRATPAPTTGTSGSTTPSRKRLNSSRGTQATTRCRDSSAPASSSTSPTAAARR